MRDAHSPLVSCVPRERCGETPLHAVSPSAGGGGGARWLEEAGSRIVPATHK